MDYGEHTEPEDADLEQEQLSPLLLHPTRLTSIWSPPRDVTKAQEPAPQPGKIQVTIFCDCYGYYTSYGGH